MRQDCARKGEARLLRSAGVVVAARMDCCPGQPACGSKRLIGEVGRRRLHEAGFVRFREPEGHLEIWDADDGTVLAAPFNLGLRPLQPTRGVTPS